MIGGGWAWGVDVDTHAAHIAVVSIDGSRRITTAFRWERRRPTAGLAPARRLSECRDVVVLGASELAVEFPPATIAVERPTGAHPSPPLMMHAGVVAEALCSSTGLAPFFLAVAEWRKGIGLSGNCGKADVVAWATELGWEQTTVDEAEALGIATAAARAWRPPAP